MAGGYKQIKGTDGNTFSKDNQPDKYRGPSLVTKMKNMLKDDPERVTTIMEALLKKAEDGDLKAVEILLTRVDGKPKETVEVTTSTTKPPKKHFG